MSPNIVTVLHHAEALADIPKKRTIRYKAPLMVQGRREIRDLVDYDTSNGIADWPTDYFDEIVRAFRADGKGTVGSIGDAGAYLFVAKDIVSYGRDWMETNLRS